MRYSKQRELVLQKVEQLCDHPTAEEIFDLAAKECPGLSLGTVYRNLNSLVDAGRVRRVSIPGKADRFDHTLGWHSHLYCNCCGGVVDADVDEKQVMKLVRVGSDGRGVCHEVEGVSYNPDGAIKGFKGYDLRERVSEK